MSPDSLVPRSLARTIRLHGVAVTTAFLAGCSGLPRRTALDDYVEAPDPSYAWRAVSTVEDAERGVAVSILELTSQTWRTTAELDRVVWKHWLVVIRPKALRTSTALLLIGGGSNRGEAPDGPSREAAGLAALTGSVVVELRQVPNQPLVFQDDPTRKERVEDDFIVETWRRFLDSGDRAWPARLPMVKSAVRAMDAAEEFLSRPENGATRVEGFVVAGGSKRGWTTWLTGAVDRRVVAIAPIVIDVLNLVPSMEHHHAAYGFWAPAVGEYERGGIFARMHEPGFRRLLEIEDPYEYRQRLTMPKLVINSTGDQFFLPDSSRFYFDDLVGEKHLRYVPNSDHGLGGSDALETLAAFFVLVAEGRPRPEVAWTFEADGAIVVRAAAGRPGEARDRALPDEVRLWRADNPAARDFRLETLGPVWTSTRLEARADGTWRAEPGTPKKGWRAAFVELTFSGSRPSGEPSSAAEGPPCPPLKLTTPVRILPDALPFADGPSS